MGCSNIKSKPIKCSGSKFIQEMMIDDVIKLIREYKTFKSE